ncbi:hypothetical protein NDU88_001781 [Pleurodeles waltl]|uniref:Uncharacterized protein n=1 Tax=Pleurodeles waltl TaxID=8319 RepID=A0AAV7LYM6_PLEWA|nr:hypothetical protein NDU88_001781 [Pleurodeles waltl]
MHDLCARATSDGNANAGLLSESRKIVLMCLNPKLCDLAKKEISDEARGLLVKGWFKPLTKVVLSSISKKGEDEGDRSEVEDRVVPKDKGKYLQDVSVGIYYHQNIERELDPEDIKCLAAES